jgi:hypothetical protein
MMKQVIGGPINLRAVARNVVYMLFYGRWDAVSGRIGVVSHHLRSLLGAIELTVLCAFVCIVGYFDAQSSETLLYT